MSYSFFIAITWRAWKGYFAWKELKVDYSKNIWKEGNPGHGFFVLWLATYQWKKVNENCNCVGAGAHKGGKELVFGPTLTLILSIFWERKKGKLNVLTKVGLSTFKEIL